MPYTPTGFYDHAPTINRMLDLMADTRPPTAPVTPVLRTVPTPPPADARTVRAYRRRLVALARITRRAA